MTDSRSAPHGSEPTDGADDALVRLVDADPAREITAAPGLEALVAARLASDGGHLLGGQAAAAAAGVEADVVDLAPRRRRPRWLSSAAAAAAAVVVAGAGYAAGSSDVSLLASSSDDSAEGAELAQEEAAAAADGSAAWSESGQGAAPPIDLTSPSLGAGADTSVWNPWSSGRNSFSATGLSAEATTADGYGLDVSQTLTPEAIADLAAALGVAGEVESLGYGWWVGPQDGSAPMLSVSPDGTGSFWFSSGGGTGCSGDGTEAVCGENGEGLPSSDDAIAELREVLVSTGQDAADFEFGPTYLEQDSSQIAVSAWRVIDGSRTDLSWNLTASAGEGRYIWGYLGAVVDLGSYPVISEQEALERLSDSRFGATQVGWAEVLAYEAGAWEPSAEPPAPPSAGDAVPWPVGTVEIVSARLGLGQHWGPDGEVWLVPTYELADATGGTWSVIGVATAMLDLSSP